MQARQQGDSTFETSRIRIALVARRNHLRKAVTRDGNQYPMARPDASYPRLHGIA